MGLFDIDWIANDVKPKVLSELNRTLQPNETFLHVGEWQTVEKNTVIFEGNSDEQTVRKFFVLGLTEEHLYVATKSGFLQNRLGNSWSRHLSTMTEGNFVRHMNKKGILQGYQFVFPASQGLEGGDYRSPTKVSEPFKEQFETVMTRYKAVAASVDVAAQLSAMHQLWTEGVLSDEEYNKAKSLFLGRSPDQQKVAENNLRSLKQLKDTGILSEAEFAAKKWEILSN